ESVDLFFHRTIKPPVEENGMIVTARAPFRGPSADHVLHVLDRFSVPLIVERSKVMHRRIPLIVNILVAAATFFAGHEKWRRNRTADIGLRRRGEERAARSCAFAFHR